jgi:hypothetical protein
MTWYVVWCPERDEDRSGAAQIAAASPLDAAQQWARKADARTPKDSIAMGEPAEVWVAEVGRFCERSVRVCGRMVPEYRAEYVKESK